MRIADKVLEISESATTQQIRDAYKKAALKTHPDRVPTDSPERAARTRKFQLVNDAYYTLSDSSRRREYDAQRKIAGGFPSWAWNFFTGQSNPQNTQQARQEKEDQQFGDVFEEMLREEGMAEQNNRPTGKFWSMAGGLSGGVLGFILANFPGLLAGAAAGNRLGAVRDARGKSVYSVFQELPQAERATLLSQLAAKIFAQTVGI
ncbi:DnaJ domain-containing protein [Truncatella angustata]|uniref:DnaJ domain-containing protein n=1 Tax=Truncatella angustata TaxID=152316 RepID=A0A9P9A2E6_9PEZI|nr:DnaJ domain-containing protein [Truncatella angustata]KAH6660631.1 DnaJ domain-containing protein [Truncatella angustata]